MIAQTTFFCLDGDERLTWLGSHSVPLAEREREKGGEGGEEEEGETGGKRGREGKKRRERQEGREEDGEGRGTGRGGREGGREREVGISVWEGYGGVTLVKEGQGIKS